MHKRTILACSCGATHIVSVADFQAQRAWIGEHRPHGQIRQATPEEGTT